MTEGFPVEVYSGQSHNAAIICSEVLLAVRSSAHSSFWDPIEPSLLIGLHVHATLSGSLGDSSSLGHGQGISVHKQPEQDVPLHCSSVGLNDSVLASPDMACSRAHQMSYGCVLPCRP